MCRIVCRSMAVRFWIGRRLDHGEPLRTTGEFNRDYWPGLASGAASKSVASEHWKSGGLVEIRD